MHTNDVFLPKLHKNPLKLRPIISCTNGPTHTASALLDKLLQPYMKATKSYIKNSTDLIHILNHTKVPLEAYLITLDIESLYTNISHNEAILSFLRIFAQHPQKVFLLDLLKYVLKNNIFKFDNLLFTQTCGLAMGTKLAPALATIYIGQIEETFLERRPKKPTLWVRYIDDVFLIWPHSLKEFNSFLADLNKQHERIKFASKISTLTCNFLDITIYKAPSFQQTGTLSTKIYYKPTNTFAFPLGSNYMSSHIHKGIVIGEITRIIRNTTSPSLCNLYKRRIIKQFRRGGYLKRIIRILLSMKHLNREALLLRKRKRGRTPGEKGIPLVLEFMEHQPLLKYILRRRWKITHNDFRLMTLFPHAPTPIYTNRKKLGSILSRKRWNYNIPPSDPKLLPCEAIDFKFLKFNHPKPPPSLVDIKAPTHPNPAE